MIFTASELRRNLDKYIELSKKEDVMVTKYGKTITTLTSPKKYKRKIAESLFGSAPGYISLKQAKDIRSDNL